MEPMTRKEAAKYLKMSPVTVGIWDRKYPHRLGAVKLPNGRIRYYRERLDEFLATCGRDSAATSNTVAGGEQSRE